MPLTVKLTQVDAETLRDTLHAVLAMSANTEGVGLRFATLCGWSTSTEVKYIDNIARLTGYFETVCKIG